TNSAGQFLVPNMKPGRYEIKISKQGFQTAVLKDQTVEIGKQLTENVPLKVGVVTEEVTVNATAVQLQTLDASVGNVFDQVALDKLPSLSRDATAILLIQPLAAPGFNTGAAGSGEGNLTGGGIAGARADQNTFMVDGGDATSNTEGGGGYAQQAASGFAATPRAAIPTPVESLQEMRVVTNNSNTFSRSSGGEVQMVTRSGTNAWHGAAYENNQNTDYNANTWPLNSARKTGCLTNDPSCFGKPRGIWIDNRFGGRLGGPIQKYKAFVFVMFEGQRFKKANPITRLVPSALMRQGILQFRDCSAGTISIVTGACIPNTPGTPSGVVRSYNLLGNTGCGATGTSPCDPRFGIGPVTGLNPVIQGIWKMEPAGNNPSEGDGLNTIGFDSSVPVVVNDNFAVTKFDYKFNDRWDLSTSYHYAVSDGVGSGQSDIGGLISGHTLGSPVATRTLPTQPRYLTLGTTGHLTSN